LENKDENKTGGKGGKRERSGAKKSLFNFKADEDEKKAKKIKFDTNFNSRKKKFFESLFYEFCRLFICKLESHYKPEDIIKNNNIILNFYYQFKQDGVEII